MPERDLLSDHCERKLDLTLPELQHALTTALNCGGFEDATETAVCARSAAYHLDCLRAENERLREVEKAARVLDALFDKKNEGALPKPGGEDEWKLDGRRQTFDVSMALLILHDCLNDVEQGRSGAFDERQVP